MNNDNENPLDGMMEEMMKNMPKEISDKIQALAESNVRKSASGDILQIAKGLVDLGEQVKSERLFRLGNTLLVIGGMIITQEGCDDLREFCDVYAAKKVKEALDAGGEDCDRLLSRINEDIPEEKQGLLFDVIRGDKSIEEARGLIKKMNKENGKNTD